MAPEPAPETVKHEKRVKRTSVKADHPSRSMRRRQDAATAFALLIPAALFYGAFQFFPIVAAFLLSLVRWNGINIHDAQFVGLDNFATLFQDPIFWTALRNNVIVAVAVIVLQSGGAFLLASVIHAKIRGASLFRMLFFAPVVISSIAVGMLAMFLFSPTMGLLNVLLRSIGLSQLAQPWLGSFTFALPSVILTYIWQSFGLSMLLFLSGMQQVPPEICEAALMDGASQQSILWQIILPIIRPVASVVVLLGVISAFRLFDTVYIMTSGGPYHASDVLVTYLYDVAFNGDQVGYGNAIGVVLFAIIFVISIVQLRLTRAGESSL